MVPPCIVPKIVYGNTRVRAIVRTTEDGIRPRLLLPRPPEWWVRINSPCLPSIRVPQIEWVSATGFGTDGLCCQETPWYSHDSSTSRKTTNWAPTSLFSRVVVFWVDLSLGSFSSWVGLSLSSGVVGERSRHHEQSNYCTCRATLST